jgi:hypothetical protein
MVQDHVRRAARRAQVKPDGVHVLRHTFCSHLAVRGAPTRAIQELAGHQDISTTQRYMHLSPAAADRAIALLERDHASSDGDFWGLAQRNERQRSLESAQRIARHGGQAPPSSTT